MGLRVALLPARFALAACDAAVAPCRTWGPAEIALLVDHDEPGHRPPPR